MDEFTDMPSSEKSHNNPYLKYTIYGRFHSNICGSRCRNIVEKPIFQKCSCYSKDQHLMLLEKYFSNLSK